MPVERVRIKKGVRPYGGRSFDVKGRHTYPNGRRVVQVVVSYRHGSFGQWDVREYNEDEVEPLNPNSIYSKEGAA